MNTDSALLGKFRQIYNHARRCREMQGRNVPLILNADWWVQTTYLNQLNLLQSPLFTKSTAYCMVVPAARMIMKIPFKLHLIYLLN